MPLLRCRWSPVVFSLSTILLLSSACEGTDAVLFVDVTATYRPGTEFDRVDVELTDAAGTVVESAGVAALADDDFTAGVRVAELSGLPSGDYRLVGRLSRAGEVVATRHVSVPLVGSVGLTIAFQAPACIVASEVCNGLDDDCDGEVDEIADDGAPTLCALDGVADSACVSGRCEVVTCVDGRDDCDGEAVTGCETDLRMEDGNCGSCGVACETNSSCERAACRGRGRYVADRIFPGQVYVASLGDSGVVVTSLDGGEVAGYSPALEERFRTWPLSEVPAQVTVQSRAIVRGGAGKVHVLMVLRNAGATDATLSSLGRTSLVLSPGDRRGLVVHLSAEGVRDSVSLVSDELGGASGSYGARLMASAEGYLLSGATGSERASRGSAFLISFSPTGEERWRRILAGGGGDLGGSEAFWSGGALAPDGTTIVWAYSAGWTEGEIDFGSGGVVVSADMGLLASYDGAGELVWLERIAGTIRAAAVDDEGRTHLVAASTRDPIRRNWIEVRDTDGALLDTRETPIFGSVVSMAAGPGGDEYVAHELAWSTDFGGGLRMPLLSGPSLVSYDPTGAYRYDKFYSEPGSGAPRWVGTGAGHVFVSGYFRSGLDFGGGLRTAAGAIGYFLLALRD